MSALQTPELEQGWEAPKFSLKGTDGEVYNFSDICGKKGIVVMFICNHCPFVQLIISRIVRDAKELQRLGIGVVAIMSNDVAEYPADSFENMKKFTKKHSFTFPYLYDETQQVAKDYGAVCTPDFFGFNGKGELQYRGRLDAANTKAMPDPRRDLFLAMKDVVKTGTCSTEQTPSIGCSIKWKETGI